MILILALLSCALAIAQFALPKRYAFAPILFAACHTANAPFVGDFNTVRIVIICGIIRAAANGDFKLTLQNRFDRLILSWVFFALLSSVGHSADTALWTRMRWSVDICGSYFYGKSYLRSIGSIENFARILLFVLVPFAALIAYEHKTGRNPYYKIGAKNAYSIVRDGKIRAQGPFGHPILTGTLGASTAPFFLVLWRQRRKAAIVGLAASATITYASASSGPMAAFAVGMAGAVFWRWRPKLRALQFTALAAIALMQILMDRPFWYVMASVDLVGGSTGWYRARLMEQAMWHLNEWWLFGTDYTRHWMPTGVSSSPDHSDMVNYFVHQGVLGGLGVMLSFVGLLVFAFLAFGKKLRACRQRGDVHAEFAVWCAGCALLTHTVSFVSISYFDQMYVFVYMLIGLASNFHMAPFADLETATNITPRPPEAASTPVRGIPRFGVAGK